MITMKLKPTSPGQRGATRRDFSVITKSAPTKSLIKSLKKTGGRNNQGRITVRHIGGGHKRRLRVIDFSRNINLEGVVESIEYDPNRSAFIALIAYQNGSKAYVVAPKNLKVGDTINADEKTLVKIGNSMMLKHIPTGIAIHNIELEPGRGASLARSAGMYATIMAHEEKTAVIKLPSGELRRIINSARATVGEVSNTGHENTVYGKAGRKRWLGIRPTVRGKAMNPNTHPHGGGEGVTPIGIKYPKTPWGAPALGHPTRNKNKASKKFIIRRSGK